jgi:hypothetical protein
MTKPLLHSCLGLISMRPCKQQATAVYPVVRPVGNKVVLSSPDQSSHVFLFDSTIGFMSSTVSKVASLGMFLVASDKPADLRLLQGSVLSLRTGDRDQLRYQLAYACENPHKKRDLAAGAQNHVPNDHNSKLTIRQCAGPIC